MKPEDIEKFTRKPDPEWRAYRDPITVRQLLYELLTLAKKDKTVMDKSVAVRMAYDECGVYLVNCLPRIGFADDQDFEESEDGDTLLIR